MRDTLQGEQSEPSESVHHERAQQSSNSLIQNFGITIEVLDNLEEQLSNNKSLFN